MGILLLMTQCRNVTETKFTITQYVKMVENQ